MYLCFICVLMVRRCCIVCVLFWDGSVWIILRVSVWVIVIKKKL